MKKRKQFTSSSHLNKSKRSQQSIGMSFGVIFSIILIIFFLLIAFIAIRAFLGTKDCTQVGIFLNDFEEEVTNTWNSQGVSTNFKRTLPTKVEYVCFIDYNKNPKGEFNDVYDRLSYYKGSGANLFFYPKDSACKTPYKTIKHLDLESITNSENPNCISVERGVIRMSIKKDFNDRLVKVSSGNI